MGFLDINRATKSYGAVKVLHETNISVEEGEFLVLVGPSGCGKSTLLNMIAGLEEITTGDIAIKGRSMNGRAAGRAQHRDGVPVLRALSQHERRPEHRLRPRDARRAEARARQGGGARSPSCCRSSTCSTASPASSRAASASAWRWAGRWCATRTSSSSTSRLSNLDAKLRVDMRTEIKKLHQKLETTIVYVTHDQIEAMTLSTRIAVMYGGHVQQLGTPKEIYDDPANIFVAGFMGSPSMNLFPAKVAVRERPSRWPRRRSAAAATGALPLRARTRHRRRMTGARSSSASAPRRSPTATAPTATAAPSTASRRRVEVTEPAGSDTFVVTHLGGKEVTGRFRADVDVRSGETFPFAINMEKAVAFDPGDRARIVVMRGRPDIVIIGSGIGGATLAAAPRAERAADRDPRARRATRRLRPRPATTRRSSRAAISAPTRPGSTPTARPSTRATTTTSAATRSSTARC